MTSRGGREGLSKVFRNTPRLDPSTGHPLPLRPVTSHFSEDVSKSVSSPSPLHMSHRYSPHRLRYPLSKEGHPLPRCLCLFLLSLGHRDLTLTSVTLLEYQKLCIFIYVCMHEFISTYKCR